MSQAKDTLPSKKDSIKKEQPKPKPKDSLIKRTVKDSLKRSDSVSIPPNIPPSNFKDSTSNPSLQVNIQLDTSASIKSVTTLPTKGLTLSNVLAHQRFFNANQPSESLIQHERYVEGKEVIFYSLGGLLLILALFKTFYKNYFNNLFRYFFNTSLRQSQLREQLVQAQWPSFFLNLFFIIAASFYLSALWEYYSFSQFSSWAISLLTFCAVIGGIYLIKYLVIKFLGWISGLYDFTDQYIFIIFLINKVGGILLLPFIILIAFSDATMLKTLFTISYLLLIFLVLIRYFKSFSALDKKIPTSRFHFILYIVGGEILPVLILYKIAVDYLGYT